MKLVITDPIFDEFPKLVLGVVILHNIDNSQNRPEITELLRQAEAALYWLSKLYRLSPAMQLKLQSVIWQI